MPKARKTAHQLTKLKNVCQEYEIDAWRLRGALRRVLEHKRCQRWEWKSDDPELEDVRRIAKDLSR